MKKTLTLIFAMALFSCSVSNPKIYEKNSPKFDIRKYFDGKLEAYGVVKDWRGKINRRFYATMEGKWNGNEGILAEEFLFDDGEKQTRTWKIKMIDDNNFTAQAGDVIGDAKGAQYGNTLRMDYVLKTPVGNKTYDLAIEDWIYLIDEKHVINESKIKKFGLTLGYLTIGFNKL
jgi:hypothetical protein